MFDLNKFGLPICLANLLANSTSPIASGQHRSPVVVIGSSVVGHSAREQISSQSPPRHAEKMKSARRLSLSLIGASLLASRHCHLIWEKDKRIVGDFDLRRMYKDNSNKCG
ncbi:unnamed protein product [Linum trigynum]|uniref:Uncharacterized protein n=1 Tax=Linum trigynum TaxID=586398 RepID=A0AAV2EAW3_9ROSI